MRDHDQPIDTDEARLRAALTASLGGDIPVPDSQIEASTRELMARVATPPATLVEAVAQGRSQTVPSPARWRRPLQMGAWTFVAGAVLVFGLVVRVSHRASAPWRQYATQPGERLAITLSDGTAITLAPASTLRVPVDYAAGNRRVSLNGEAYLSVTHDAAHPFAVAARGALVQDIGTVFDVRAYASDPDVRVGVTDGQVRVGAAHAAAQARRAPPAHADLTAGDVAVIDTAVAITHNADVATMTAWTTGRLVFADTPLREVVPALERWYGLDVRLADPALGGRRLRATYGPDESISEVVGSLAPALGLRAAWDGTHRVTLSQGQ